MQLLMFDVGSPQRARIARNDVMKGDAAEALVIFKLLKLGYDAHDARRDAPYDVGVDLRDGRIARVQVKGHEQSRSGRWDYRFIRGNWRSATGTYAYNETDYDVTACVALSIEKVLFFPGVQSSIRLRTADFLRPDAEQHSWEQALRAFKRKPLLTF